MAEKVVRIEWEGPCAPSDVVCTDSGVYQFYGWHPCFCDNSLLYIGKADGKAKGRKGLKGRLNGKPKHEFLNENIVPKFFRPKEIMVHWGRIIADDAELTLEEVEGILIFTHNPPWNSDSIRLFSFDTYNGVVIENMGNSGDLVRKFSIGKDDIEVIEDSPRMKAKSR